MFNTDFSGGCSRLQHGDCVDFPGTEESLFLSRSFVDACNKKHGIPKKTARHVQICSDEIMTNIVNYAHANTVRLYYRIEDSMVNLTFEDDGILYDPLQSKAPDVTLAAKERLPGGLGLFMVRKISKSMDYEETNGWNRLRIAIELPPDRMIE